MKILKHHSLWGRGSQCPDPYPEPVETQAPSGDGAWSLVKGTLGRKPCGSSKCPPQPCRTLLPGPYKLVQQDAKTEVTNGKEVSGGKEALCPWEQPLQLWAEKPMGTWQPITHRASAEAKAPIMARHQMAGQERETWTSECLPPGRQPRRDGRALDSKSQELRELC